MIKGASILLALIVLFSFPLWIGLIAGGFGLIIGIFGAVFGVLAGIIGAIIGAIGWLVDGIFGGVFRWGDGWIGSFPSVHLSGFEIALIIVVIALIYNGRKKTSQKKE